MAVISEEHTVADLAADGERGRRRELGGRRPRGCSEGERMAALSRKRLALGSADGIYTGNRGTHVSCVPLVLSGDRWGIDMVEALNIHVQGIVQGVGFRPFVYRMAKKYLINGWVLNASDGVHIHAEGESKLLDEFVLELSDNAPAASHVTQIELAEVPLEDFDSFEIRFSDAAEVEQTTLVSPELATCEDCLHELFNPNDRRYRYPFINCTNCGPRFTIIERLPYDRAATSMRAFKMCDRCASEYADPLDRRFHAQPDACFECGPAVTWREEGAETPAGEDAEADGEVDGMSFAEGHEETSEEKPVGEIAEASTKALAGKPTSGLAETLAEGSSTAPTRNVSRETFVRGTSREAAFKPGAVYRGSTREESDAIFARAAELLCAGKILAVKGLGGFHLVCDANNAEAVATLRARKRREGKAFAVMLSDAEAARAVCEVSEEEEAVLAGAQRPIVLLRKRAGVDEALAPRLADGLSELGVMLPYTPVQHLLMHDFAEASAQACVCALPPMLVMTSGNLHDEPIVTSDEEAYEKLAGAADAFLGNDREILTRFDDSVVRVIRAGSSGSAVQFIRRARGYAPLPLALKLPGSVSSGEQPMVFATGPEQKNTFTMLRAGMHVGESGRSAAAPDARAADASAASGTFAARAADEKAAGASGARAADASATEGAHSATTTKTALVACEAFVSQHVGDMENAETYDAWLAAKKRYQELFEISPTMVACDMHPEYLSSKWAHDQALPVCEVQHHHAHIASVMAESGLSEAVCGIAFDGTGYGVDGAIWGGEVLLANLQAFERFASFVYVPMPGGAAAIKHPLRMAYGVLWAYDLLDHPAARAALEPLGSQAGLCDAMIEKNINTPMTSSVGRLFDAASALLGICVEPAYEGEGACLLEAAIGAEELSCGKALAGGDGASASDAEPEAHAAGNVSRETLAAASASVARGGASRLARSDDADESAARERYAVAVTKNVATEMSTAQDTSVLLLDAEPTFRALLDDMAAGVPRSTIARRFHDAFAGVAVTSAELARALYGINTVALSGGVFMNRYLIEHVLAALEEAGFTAAISRDVPPNDGCISLGQAVVAWAQKQAM